MRETRPSLRIEVLGPLRVYSGPVLIDLGPSKQRAIFAVFSLHAGEAVSMEVLLESVWGEHRPPSARHLVHTYVARLRKLLEPEEPGRRRFNVIRPAPSGYRLAVDGQQVDLVRFRQLVARGRLQLSNSDLARAFDLYGEALRLWRDPVLLELGELLPGSVEVEVLRRTWTAAALDLVTFGLELHRAPAVLDHARQLATVDPLNEQAQARYLAVLEQTGQRAAAIEHFQDLRARLSNELGVQPGPQLTEMYRQVLLGAPRDREEVRLVPAVVAVARPPWRGPGPRPGDLLRREADLSTLSEILSRQRVLTIAGPPGCGKSALALHTAAKLRDGFLGGVAVADCSDLRDAEQIRRCLLETFACPPEVGDVSKEIGDQQVLLVLDNVEHLVEPGAVLVDEVVRSCPYASVLVTSREPLGLPEETVWRVGALDVPDHERSLWPGDNPAVMLFLRRAQQVCPGFRLAPENVAAVVTICQRLDGLPLAVEMAAACLATDTVDGVVRRLDDPLHLIRPLRRGPPAHHQSLHVMLQRSYECLNELERWCFRCLGRLPATFALSVAHQAWVAAPWRSVDVRNVLARLVDKSLLMVEHTSAGPKYRMLGLIHRFAAELAAAELAAADSA